MTKAFNTFSACDERGRYWEVDYTVTEGCDPVFYNGTILPGDDPIVRILGGRVELMSFKRTKKKTLQVSADVVERTFSDNKIHRKIFLG